MDVIDVECQECGAPLTIWPEDYAPQPRVISPEQQQAYWEMVSREINALNSMAKEASDEVK